MKRKWNLQFFVIITFSLLGTFFSSCNNDSTLKNPDNPIEEVYVDAVDLGLPSGTKWSNKNLGAMNSEDFGYYFAWGETSGYLTNNSDVRLFNWDSYKWYNGKNGQYETLSKYSIDNYCGIVDNKIILELEDDAAHIIRGAKWVMPTYEDYKELLDNTTSEWITINGVNGTKFTSKTNNNVIFLPACGQYDDEGLKYQNEFGYYWSSALSESGSLNAYFLAIYSKAPSLITNIRCYGFSVRPIIR